MKTMLLLSAFLTACIAFGQSFHFDNDSTTLIKNTSQSPAHWYLEVINDAGVDTTLRWKASFSNMQAAWEVSFDDQDNFYGLIVDGDSADFTLFAGLTFPQKLIIGNTLNNTPGNGSVYFDVYDPQDLATTETIVYHFIISPNTADAPVMEVEQWYTFSNNTLEFSENLQGKTLQVYSLSGQLLMETIIDGTVALESSTMGSEIQLIRVRNEEITLSSKVMVE